jgi:hypothetical protein
MTFYPFTQGMSRDFQENFAFVVNLKDQNPVPVGTQGNHTAKYRLPAGFLPFMAYAFSGMPGT